MVIVTAGLPAYAEAPEIQKMLSDYILPAVKSDAPLGENAQGVAQLQSAVETAAHPVRAVADLPAAALNISGSVYTFADNAFGWQSLRFVFTPGASAAQLNFNGSADLEIGLDNLYRQSNTQMLGTVLLRGHWIDEKTFAADYPYSIYGPTRLGELGETEMRFQFDGDQLTMTSIPKIFGGEPIVLQGKR